jgi:hypothetical protein
MAGQDYLDICEEVASSVSPESAHGAWVEVERRWGISPGLSGVSQCQL